MFTAVLVDDVAHADMKASQFSQRTSDALRLLPPRHQLSDIIADCKQRDDYAEF